MVAQALQRQAGQGIGGLGQLRGRLPRFVAQLGGQVVQRGTAQVQARRQRAFDFDVKPAFNRARDELVGHDINHRAGQQAHQREDGRQLDQQPAAKAAAAHAQRQAQRDPADDQQQQARYRHVQAKQHSVVAFVQIAVAGGLRQQKQQHQPQGNHDAHADADGPAKGFAAFDRAQVAA